MPKQINPKKFDLIAGGIPLGMSITYNELNALAGCQVQKKQANVELSRLGFVKLRWKSEPTWRRDSLVSIDPYARGEDATYAIMVGLMRTYTQPSWSMKELKIALGFHPTKASIRALMPRMGFAWDDKAHRWIKE
jgi:hypothetical protein